MPIDSRKLGLTGFQAFATCLAAIGSFNFGWNNGSVNLPSGVLKNCVTGRKYWGPFPSCIYVKSGTVWGIVVGLFAIGCIIGAVISNPVINRKGYKFTMTWFALFNVAGALLLSLTTKIPQFIIGRLVVGVAAGAANNAMATYVSDIATDHARTILGGALQFACNTGIMIDNACAMGLSGPPRWRILFSLTGALGLINFALFPLAPESPKWLVKMGRVDEARAALQKFRAGADINREMHSIIREDKLSKARTHDVSIWELIGGTTPDNLRHQLVCCSMLMFLQQMSGINGVIFFSTTIIDGTTHSDPSKLPTLAMTISFLVSVAADIFTFLGMILFIVFGRRQLLMFSHFMMALWSSMIVCGMKIKSSPLVIVSVFLFNAVFNLGVGPIPWAAAGEMTPSYAMTAMSAIGTGIGYLFTFVIGVYFPPMSAAWRDWTFFWFMGWNLFAVVFVYFFIPETMDRSIEDTVAKHSCGIHFVLGKRWYVPTVTEKKELQEEEDYNKRKEAGLLRPSEERDLASDDEYETEVQSEEIPRSETESLEEEERAETPVA